MQFKKPQTKDQQTAIPVNSAAVPADRNLMRVIEKGGGVAKKSTISTDKTVNQNLDLPEDMNADIDEICKKYPIPPGKKVGISKRQWLHMAVFEKFDVDKQRFGL